MSQRPENRQRADGWAEGEGLGMDVRGSKGFEFVCGGEGEWVRTAKNLL